MSNASGDQRYLCMDSPRPEGDRPGVVAHHLKLDPSVKPVKQKKRHFGPKKDKIIRGEVNKLLLAEHIKEIQLPEWLSNIVLVPKPDGKWWMCIDFRDLHKAYPNDFYPLPRIDQLVDSTSGCELLSIMDASQGYHQIMLASEDHKRWRAFRRIHSNPTRHRGQPRQDQGYPRHGTPHKYQRSTTTDRKNAALSRFISKSAEEGLPFFRTLRKVKNFEWMEKYQRAFEDLKAYLAKLPLLVNPIPGDTLYLYLSSTSQTVSSVLVREENSTQTPIYYFSKVLNGAECCYPSIEKIALAWSSPQGNYALTSFPIPLESRPILP
ncbi:UNVERIFIED_CONTAM: Transposon Ty3-G Gag-Pol polyprotein [Sesamum radiatum]|uniref:Transposon Ty3-G Gag-Pol polyprotein n=1 Tax=Sesamum radiatum TaxID=300843 RepID=A0AAW2N9V1_SESRA